MSTRDEYGLNGEDDHEEKNSKGSEASRKAWETARKQGEERANSRTLKILEARRAVLLDKTLSREARLLYVWLLDLALWKRVGNGEGVVSVSGSELCKQLGYGEELLTKCKRELVWARYVWLTEQRKNGEWNQHVYHIQALDPQEQYLAQKTVDGILRHDAPDRPAPPPPKKRPSPVSRRPIYIVDENGNPQPLDNQGDGSVWPSGRLGMANASPRPSECDASAGPGATPRYGEGDASAKPGASPRYGEGDASAGPGATPLPDGGDGLGGSRVLIKESQVNAEAVSLLEAVNRLNGAGAALGGKKGSLWAEVEAEAARPDSHALDENSESDFLEFCRQVMGKGEVDDTPGGLKGNGGMWRLNFRGKAKRGGVRGETPAQARARCWRVMREAHSRKKEGFKPDRDFASYCMDLWLEGRV